MGEPVSRIDVLVRRCASAEGQERRPVAVVEGRFDPLRLTDLRRLQEARTTGALVVAAVRAESDGATQDLAERLEIVAALACVDYAIAIESPELEGLHARLCEPAEAPATRDEGPGELVSWHRDRVVHDQGDRFLKRFSSKRDRDGELKRLWRLKSIGVNVPEVIECPPNAFVTAPLPGIPLDELIRTRWAAMPRSERSRLIERVAALCRRIRDGGYDWPDLVTYHIYVAKDRLSVLDPARLRRGRLELSPLFWSTEEPTVSRSDRLRFWRRYAGRVRPPRVRAIGYRGRFRPYRWVVERTRIRSCPPFDEFVNAIGAPFESADEVAAHAGLKVKRRMADRVNGELDDLVVKMVRDPGTARLEWENHRRMIASGFRVPQPAVGGILENGWGLFSTVRLAGQAPMDRIWETLDPRVAVRAVADVVRRLHAGGLVHKDLYLNHFYIARGGRHPTLIDLGRMERSTSRRLRIKDLAALYLSARGLCSGTDLWRGLRRYGGGRREARAILRKAVRMARHVPRKLRDGDHRREPPCTSG